MSFFGGWGKPKKTARELKEEQAKEERDAKQKAALEEANPEQYLSYSSLYGERGEIDPGKSFQLNRGYGFDPVSAKAKSQQLTSHSYRPQDLQSDQKEEDKDTKVPKIPRPF